MTLENAKRLYQHYLDTNQSANAENMLKKRPDLAKKPKEKEKNGEK
jgi:hypothetical protein